MNLVHKNTWLRDEYYCPITTKLDELIGVADKSHHFKNYLLDTRDVWDNTFSIRIPGRTTGVIRLDKSNIIIECLVDDPRYPDNTNEILKQFVGELINMES